MNREAKELVEELIRRLEERGTPAGAWLIEIESVRASLHDADDLLRRLRDAIIRSAGTSTLALCAALDLLG